MRLRVSLIAAMLLAGVWVATPARAAMFFFSTGNPDGKMGALSRRPSTGQIETETADDFILTETTVIRGATIVALIPAGASLADIENVEVELYHVFPRDSGPPSGKVPSRINSPADVEIGAATRDASLGTLDFTPSLLNSTFKVDNTVVNGIVPKTGGEGARTGEEVQIAITFNGPIVLPADHYFFRPEALLMDGDFLYLSAPKPIMAPGTPFPPLTTDLQAWIRNSTLAPDWLKIGTDIVAGTPAPQFNMTFSLTGETVPAAGTPGQANCHGKSVSALAHQFGGLAGAASALGFSSVNELQQTLGEFCRL
jgi:hypothetical protein